jgi:hypothetical protein
VAGLLDLLASIPEGEGTLLDHTLVVWHNEIATGEHTLDAIPWVIAGGAETLRLGRYHRWVDEVVLDTWEGPRAVGRPHNQALTTVANELGLAVDHVGDTEVWDVDGARVDLTGPLPGVTW